MHSASHSPLQGSSFKGWPWAPLVKLRQNLLGPHPCIGTGTWVYLQMKSKLLRQCKIMNAYFAQQMNTTQKVLQQVKEYRPSPEDYIINKNLQTFDPLITMHAGKIDECSQFNDHNFYSNKGSWRLSPRCGPIIYIIISYFCLRKCSTYEWPLTYILHTVNMNFSMQKSSHRSGERIEILYLKGVQNIASEGVSITQLPTANLLLLYEIS